MLIIKPILMLLNFCHCPLQGPCVYNVTGWVPAIKCNMTKRPLILLWGPLKPLYVKSCGLMGSIDCDSNDFLFLYLIQSSPSHSGIKEVSMINWKPEASVIVVLWQGSRTEGLHFPPSLSAPPPPPFITVADGCRWIPHNHVRTAPPIPIHLFKHISSDGELHKDKGGRQTTKAHKDCPCKQVFLVPNTT